MQERLETTKGFARLANGTTQQNLYEADLPALAHKIAHLIILKTIFHFPHLV
jgi:hypothetical protein